MYASSPSLDQKRTFKSQLEIFSVLCYVVNTDYSRVARHGQSQWQHGQWKAKDAKRPSEKKKHDSILRRLQNERYRISAVLAMHEQETNQDLSVVNSFYLSHTQFFLCACGNWGSRLTRKDWFDVCVVFKAIFHSFHMACSAPCLIHFFLQLHLVLPLFYGSDFLRGAHQPSLSHDTSGPK